MDRHASVRSSLVHAVVACVAALVLAFPGVSTGADEAKNLAPGFNSLPVNAKVLITPIDVELYSISAGGIPEPRADWTSAALANMKKELGQLRERYKGESVELDERAADDYGELLALHSAVARAISIHHVSGGPWALPTKDGKLDWSFGDAMQPLQARTGARYALFVWVRDSYTSGERAAAIALGALFGVAMGGGFQQGYASLVDLETGQVLWFNRLARASGDLREPAKAAETVNALLTGFPGAR